MHDRLGHAGFIANRRTLHAFAGIGQCVLIRALGNTDAFQADIQTGVVHHREHVRQALVGFADQITDGALFLAERHDGRGATVNAHLVLDRSTDQVVTGAQAAIGIDQILRGHEQRNTFDARRCIGQTRQHEVDDVLRHVVLAPGDEDLGTANAIRAIALRHGLAANGTQIRTGLRLGQVHRTGPYAFDHFRQIGILQLFRAMMCNRFDGACGQHRAQRKRDARRFPHFLDGHRHQRRQALAAEFGRAGHGIPTGFDEQLIRVFEAIGGGHFAIFPGTALTITDRVDRIDHFGGELARFVHNGLDQIRRTLFEAGQLRDRFKTCQFVHDKLHVADGWNIDTHREAP